MTSRPNLPHDREHQRMHDAAFLVLRFHLQREPVVNVSLQLADDMREKEEATNPV